MEQPEPAAPLVSADEPRMTPAELKVAHEMLGVSTAFLALRTGKSSRMIWHYESPGSVVPDDVAQVVIELVNDRDEAANALEAHLRATGADVIERHKDLAVFERLTPQMAGWGESAQGLLLAEVQRRMRLPIDYAEPELASA